ncbi:exopolysaccharide biosynthesis polyprenyl glycosylphosphotransferase [Allopontixanthobacter confluentis]|nr:exopolysaccharide biosynthesis polyprenyl glycosylphosphotransferase [Allopontixanthobacter confluentis]
MKQDHFPMQMAGNVSRLPQVLPLEHGRIRAYLVLLVADLGLLYGGFLLAGALYLGEFPSAVASLEAQLLAPLFLTIALYQNVYATRSLMDWRFVVLRLLLALAISSALLIFFTFYFKSTTSFSRAVFTLGLGFSFIFMAALRTGAIWWLRRKWGPTPFNVLLLDAGGPAVDIAHAIHVDAAAHGLLPSTDNPHHIDRIGRYMLHMDSVIVSCPPDERENWARLLRATGIQGEIVSETLHGLGAIGLNQYEHCTSLVVSTGPLGLRARILKRGFDIGFASLALVVLSPLLLITGLLVKLNDGGPVIFVQQRMGWGNRYFSIYKFRTMSVASADASGGRSASRDDERITRIGRFLRRTSIDELPQLFNILLGNMSIVGPRPHALGSQAGEKLFWEVDGRYWRRHALKPGLTGLAQIRGFRGATADESDLSDRLHADLEYIARWSLWRDIAIIAATTRVMVHSRAY